MYLFNKETHPTSHENIQTKYNFSVTVNFEKELLFGCNKRAKTLEAKYIT